MSKAKLSDIDFDPKEYWMSKEDGDQQIKDALFDREQLRATIADIDHNLKSRARAFSETASRLASRPATVIIEKDLLYLAKESHSDYSNVPTFNTDLFSLEKLAGLTSQLREASAKLHEVTVYLDRRGIKS